MQRISGTPAVDIDESRLRANVARMQALATRHGLALRPHVKTHKSIELARIQQDAGAFGFTASKPQEAAIFAARFPSLTVAYPLVVSNPIDRLLRIAADAGCDLRFVVDSRETLESLGHAAGRFGRTVRTFIEIDVGLGRCGVLSDSRELIELARRITEDPRLELAGILSHAGHAYAAIDRSAVAAIAERERRTMLDARALLEHAGIGVPVVSVGSTPTVLAAESFEGIDEIRPGNYIMLDGTQVALGVARYDDVALSVLTTIVSRNDNHYIVDAGSKTLSSDRGAHGAERPAGYGAAFTGAIAEGTERLAVTRLSEEHGFVARGETDLPIGTRLWIVPNHACPVVNLARTMMLIGEEVCEIMVDASGCVG
jgi:D-serine deaminase-like pyridoxal phosphate-dependent protein